MSLALAPIAACAWNVTTGPIKSNITHSAARFHWVTDASVKSRWAWDTESHAGGSWGEYPNKYTGSLNLNVHSTYIAGLSAATTYYYRLCGYDGGSTICAPEDSFTTDVLPGTHPEPARAPVATVDTTMPSCNDGTLHCEAGIPVTATVGSDCDDPTTGLMALYNAAAWGDTIIVPKTTTCRNYFKLDAKAGHDGRQWIIIRTDDLDGLPGPGTRVQTSDASHMPLFQQTIWAVNPVVSGVENCWPGGYHWDASGTAPGWYMFKCAVAFSGRVTNAIGDSAGRSYDVTLAGSAPVAVNQWGYMTGVGGIAKANGSFQVTAVKDSQHFTVLMANGYSHSTGQTYAGGGTVELYGFTGPIAKQDYSGTAPTARCTTGEWAYSNTKPGGGPLVANLAVGSYTSTDYSTGRVWRCTATDTWTPHRIVPLAKQSTGGPSAVFDLTNAHHVRLIGLHLRNPAVPPDTLLDRVGINANAGWLQGASAPSTYVVTSSRSHHLIIDRCLVERTWDAKGAQSLSLDGDYIGLIDSRLQTSGNWFGAEDRGGMLDNMAGDGISSAWGGPKLLRNNHLEHYGIAAHFNDGAAGSGSVSHDITIERNLFFTDFANVHQAPGSAATKYSPLRQMLEFKRGMRVKVDGNIFRQNFQNVAQGAAIAITNVFTGGGLWCVLTHAGSDGICNTGDASDVAVGDWVCFFSNDAAKLYQVSAVAGPTSFTVANVPAEYGSGWTGIVTGRDGISDVAITNNTFDLVPTAMVSYSRIQHDTCCASIQNERFTIMNNFFKDIGPGGNGSGRLSVPESEKWNVSGGGGYLFTIWGGMEDVIWEHNTHYRFNRQGGIYDAYATYMNEVPSDPPSLENEGLRWANNLFWIQNDTEPLRDVAARDRGKAMIERFFVGPYIATNNVIVRVGGNPSGYPAGNKFLEYSRVPSPFTNGAGGEFSLIAGGIGSSAYTCFRAAGDCTTDGSDSGVDWTALNAAQGGTAQPALALHPKSHNSLAAGSPGTGSGTNRQRHD